MVKKDPNLVANKLARLKTGKEQYYHLRATNPLELTEPERAARLILLNRFCFNGLYRTNQKGEFNVPYGGTKSSKIPSPANINVCSEALQKAQLISVDFSNLLKIVASGDFVYLDPPYTIEAKRTFTGYNPTRFLMDDILRLRVWMDTLNEKDIHFVVSYAASEEACFLSEGYKSEIVQVYRSFAGFVNKRRKAEEVIISNQ